MTAVEKLQERYEIGQNIFEQLFKLTDVELKEKISSICGEQINSFNSDILSNGSEVTRTIKNEIPNNIDIYYYSGISISAFGITYKPEHGEGRKIVDFGKHFKL